MLIPLPGLSHLKVLSPVDPQPVSPATQSLPRDTRQSATVLITVALETAFGIRPVHQLSKKRFSLGVRTHVTARLRRRSLRGPVRVDSLHLRPDATGLELFGSCTVAGTAQGFTARMEQPDGRRWRMHGFRVI